MMIYHNPVLVKECVYGLNIDSSGVYVDATFGGGGYSKAMLEEFNIKNLLAIDRDPTAKIFYNELKKTNVA